MDLKHHPSPLSGGDRKALAKELGKARAMANILASQLVENRHKFASSIRIGKIIIGDGGSWRGTDDGRGRAPTVARFLRC
jgi:hypothetical protein